MKNVALSLVAVAGLSAAALAQTNSFTYNLEVVSDQVANGGSLTLPSTGGTVSFWLRARVTANSLAANNFNFGVGRASPGPAGQTAAFITVTDSVAATRLGRGTIGGNGSGANSATPLTGRGPLFRSGGTSNGTVSAWHSATENGTGGQAFPSGTGNAMGAFDQGGDRLYGFDAYGGGQRAGEENPYLANWDSVPVGQASRWYNLYRFDVLISGNSERSVTLNAAAYLATYIQYIDLGGSWTANLTSGSTGSASATAGAFTFSVIPTPGAAAVLGLAGLAAARRRRA